METQNSDKSKQILVTGAAGFIGSNFVERVLNAGYSVTALDALTYAGHLENLADVMGRINFVHGDICDTDLIRSLFAQFDFDCVVNFAAESHVDRSISGPSAFVNTNVNGVLSLLNATTEHWNKLSEDNRKSFRFLQVSTDEVYGSLGDVGAFDENTPYAPNSPYSASKAGGDLLVRAWFHTFGLPTIITNCSNNYGPKQFPEKLIPYMISSALKGSQLPVYGSGKNVRDWIHVYDHCDGVKAALERGKPGETYCLGGRSERRNLDVVNAICEIMDTRHPKSGGSYKDQIKFVEDRKGHDWRYAINDTKAERELGFTRRFPEFESGLRQTVDWYLNHQNWITSVLAKGEV